MRPKSSYISLQFIHLYVFLAIFFYWASLLGKQVCLDDLVNLLLLFNRLFLDWVNIGGGVALGSSLRGSVRLIIVSQIIQIQLQDFWLSLFVAWLQNFTPQAAVFQGTVIFRNFANIIY